MGKNKYFIQCKLKTLLSNAVSDGNNNTSFKISNYSFKHSTFNYREGWVDNFWIIEKVCTSVSYQDAILKFYIELDKILEKIEFIGQSYVGYPSVSPTLVYRKNYIDDLVFFRYGQERPGGGLMFMDKEHAALKILLKDDHVNPNFYKYWSSVTKTKDYSAKLLLQFAALDSLTRNNGKLDIELRIKILGKELNETLYNQKTGLRNRLSHGEHLNMPNDSETNYSDEIHKKVLSYFNKHIIKENLLNLNVVSPYRVDYENHSVGNWFVKTKDGSTPSSVSEIMNSLTGDKFNDESNFQFDYSNHRKKY